MATAETNDLISEVTQLPVQPGAAMRLLWMLEDPRTSASDLGRLIESDPALSTQVIRLANTAFYGLSGKVSSAWRAVTVLGLATVRAIATTAAFDLFSEKGRSVPDDFWPHSVTTAAGSKALAKRRAISAGSVPRSVAVIVSEGNTGRAAVFGSAAPTVHLRGSVPPPVCGSAVSSRCSGRICRPTQGDCVFAQSVGVRFS